MEKIIEQLAIRFEHRAEIVALDIFDPRSIPRDRSEVASYGNKELRSLFDFYVMRRTVKRKGGVRSVFDRYYDVHMRQDGLHHDEAAEQPVDDHA